MTVDVYSQYFAGECVFNEVPRRAVIVKLTCESGGGEVYYTVNLSFFPHRDEEDYAVSYDAYAEKEIFRAALSGCFSCRIAWKPEPRGIGTKRTWKSA